MVEAHGLGGGADLPIPASLAVAGGAAALTVSFVVLLLAWKRPRFADGGGEVPAPALIGGVIESRGFSLVLRVAGLGLFGFTAWSAVVGPDLATNPALGIVYVWLWVGIVPASLLFGPFFRAVSPARTIAALLTRGKPGLRELPGWVGYWPAALGLLCFVWLELVWPGALYVSSVRLWFAVYFAAMLVGTAVFGEKWLARADPFEVYSTLVGRLAIWGRGADGHVVIVSPLRNLAGLQPRPGLVAVVAVLLGSTAWDSFQGSTTWIRFLQSTSLNATLLNTVMLLLFVFAVAVTFAAATMTAGAVSGPGARRSLPPRLAHAVIPVVVGYMVAHYLSFFVEVGQLTLIQASDPMGRGSDLLGTAGWEVNYWWSQHPTVLAPVKVAAIVLGHVLGVTAAHDRSLQLLPRRSQVTGQLPLLVAMTAYTYAGLYLLFGA